jgi:hypothetical protein
MNADQFKAITGIDPPDSPMPLKDYAKLPYYKIENEKPSGIKGDFEGVKSVNELDMSGEQTAEKAQAVAEVIQDTNNPVVLLDAEGKPIGFRPVKKMEEDLRKRFGDMCI